jgi:hypothetical protein
MLLSSESPRTLVDWSSEEDRRFEEGMPAPLSNPWREPAAAVAWPISFEVKPASFNSEIAARASEWLRKNAMIVDPLVEGRISAMF